MKRKLLYYMSVALMLLSFSACDLLDPKPQEIMLGGSSTYTYMCLNFGVVATITPYHNVQVGEEISIRVSGPEEVSVTVVAKSLNINETATPPLTLKKKIPSAGEHEIIFNFECEDQFVADTVVVTAVR